MTTGNYEIINQKRKYPQTYTRPKYSLVCNYNDIEHRFYQFYAAFPLLSIAQEKYEDYIPCLPPYLPSATLEIERTNYDDLIYDYCKYRLNIGDVFLERDKVYTALIYELLLSDEDARTDFDLVYPDKKDLCK